MNNSRTNYGNGRSKSKQYHEGGQKMRRNDFNREDDYVEEDDVLLYENDNLMSDEYGENDGGRARR